MDNIFREIKEQRDKRFAQSKQLSLGELIAKLEGIGDKTVNIEFAFVYAYPTTLDSWRGSYDELALGFAFEREENEPTVESLLKHLVESVGRTFVGWKGGDYIMGKTTPVWVANPGDSGQTAIVDIIDAGWHIFIETAYADYSE